MAIKPFSQLDGPQTLKSGFDDAAQAHRVIPLASLVPEEYDSIALTYVTSGFGIGEIETVVYSFEGSDVATLTLTYNSDNKLSNVTRS